MKRVNLFIVAATLTTVISAQGLFPEVLSQVRENSKEMLALDYAYESGQVELKTGLAPQNPTVEYGYLWGKPGSIGNRQDISVTEELDFPTAYLNRKKLADSQAEVLANEYKTGRMEILMRAEQICIDLVYQNALYELYAKQTENAAQMEELYGEMSKKGAVSAIEYNNVRMNCARLRQTLSEIVLERDRLLSELKLMNGGKPIDFTDTDYKAIILPDDFTAWMEEASRVSNPLMGYYDSRKSASVRNIRAVISESMPKMSVGYTGEFTNGDSYRGVTVGVSIPLWENRHKIHHAVAQSVQTIAESDHLESDYLGRMEFLYASVKSLQKSVSDLYSVLQENSSQEILQESLQAGQISLLEYLRQMEYWYECYDSYLQSKRDMYRAYSELESFRL